MRAASVSHEMPFQLPAESIEIVLDLPVPPSVNVVRRQDNGLGRKARQKYYKNADAHVLLARSQSGEKRPLQMIIGPYELRLEISSGSKLDLDNHAKVLIDYIVSREFVIDDSPRYLRRLIVEWANIDGCKVTVRSLHG